MALPMSAATERKRVKVYELRENDWFDRGTGFCATHFIHEDGRIFVESEDEPEQTLLDIKIRREDSFQKQQDTLIVWTDQHGMDMAMSFQEADGCASVWHSISEVQHNLQEGADDFMTGPICLPPPELGHLEQIEDIIRRAGLSQMARDGIVKLILNENYLAGLTKLVEIAEDLEDLADLHRLYNVMKTLILFNDTPIMEYVVSDDIILGVVGALEYDPDFPEHKANHRRYLTDESKFKEVVPITDPNIRKRIHLIYRLQYLKDVVLARVLDDPTFNILNSLIFFHQVEVVQHIQGNINYLQDLFTLINTSDADPQKRKDAVLLIQQSCAIAKNLHLPVKASMYQNFITCGLFPTIAFALQHHEPALRVAGTDILVAGIDHDAPTMRNHIIKGTHERTKPMTDTLVELLLVETDLGVKAQIADAVKVLMDPQANLPLAAEARAMSAGMENGLQMKARGDAASQMQMDTFMAHFYNDSAKKLFKPFEDLENRSSLNDLSFHDVSTLSHLVEILCFFMRQHNHRSRQYVVENNLQAKVAKLMSCPEKHLKLTAIKFLRTCISIQDEFVSRQIRDNRLFDPVFTIIVATLPRDNLINSACLEMFEFIRHESANRHTRDLLMHLIENYRDRIESHKQVMVFSGLLLKYDQIKNPPSTDEQGHEIDSSFMTSDADTPNTRHVTINGGMRWQGLKDAEPEEDAYFEADDDEEDELARDTPPAMTNNMKASPPPLAKHLADYGDDDDDMAVPVPQQSNSTPPVNDNDDTSQTPPSTASETNQIPSSPPSPPASATTRPPSSLSEKRKRDEEDEEEDELGKLSSGIKRRSSSTNLSTSSSTGQAENKTRQTEQPQPNGIAPRNAPSENGDWELIDPDAEHLALAEHDSPPASRTRSASPKRASLRSSHATTPVKDGGTAARSNHPPAAGQGDTAPAKKISISIGGKKGGGGDKPRTRSGGES